jgi:uncharacterized protein (TIGR02118 family)
MLISLGFYKRKPGLTREEFSRHWRQVHGPMIANNPDIRKYVKRYVQHHFEPSTGWPDVGSLDYDGFSESWFESADTRKQLYTLPFFSELVADERKFIDMSVTRILMFDHQVVQIGKDYSSDWMAGTV